MQVSERAEVLQTSPLQKIAAKAKNMEGVVNFSIGELDFPTPTAAKEAGKSAIQNDLTVYTPVAGLAELRELAAVDFKNDGVKATAQNTVISAGAKPLIAAALWAICDIRDEVLIPGPYYPPYWDLVETFGATPVLVDTQPDRFQLTWDTLKKYLAEKTKVVLILNSPNNPTGEVWDWNELEELDSSLWVVADEAYHRIVYDGEYVSFASLPNRAEQTITIRSLSKTSAMSGWRIGYLTAIPRVMEKITDYLGMAVGCACSISQNAAIAAFKAGAGLLEEQMGLLGERRDYLTRWLTQMGMPYPQPKGAFYVFADISQFGKNSIEFANLLLEKAKVAVTPGVAFGPYPDFIRICYAGTPLAKLKEGLDRIDGVLENL